MDTGESRRAEISQGLKLIARAMKQDRLSHAYLVTGPQGSGKSRFVRKLAEFLLCMEPEMSGPVPQACGSCSSCRKFQREVHPDFLKLEPEGRFIRIHQVRSMQKTLSFAPLEAKRRMCAIVSADRLNIDAANALLKTLEEPPEDTHLLLACTSPSRLLPTIVSRCQVLPIKNRGGGTDFEKKFTEIIPEGAVPFLKYVSGGSPEFAEELTRAGLLDIRQTVFEFMVSAKKKELFFNTSRFISQPRERLELAIRIFQAIARDVTLLINTGSPRHNLLINRDKAVELAKLAQGTNCDSLFRYGKLIEKAEMYLQRNVNPEMISDMLLLFWLNRELRD